MKTATCQICIFAVLFCCSIAVDATESAASEPNSDEVRALLQDLGSRSFATRVAASKRLKLLSAEQIRDLAGLADSESSAEVVVRILAEIDNRYCSEVTDDVQVASNALEHLAIARRTLIADGAGQSLNEHWEKRVALAQEDLIKYGAIIRKGTFTGQIPGWPRGRSTSIQVLLTKTWTGGDEGLAIFERLSSLVSPGPGVRGISIYLIDGNPLTDAQESKLAEFVGHSRMVKRSRVALGIVSDPTVATGVLINRVSKGSSADVAGLKAGDLLIAIENTPPAGNAEPPEEESGPAKDGEAVPRKLDALVKGDPRILRDFDDLVERLKAYDEGDMMSLRVHRSFRRGHTNIFGGRFPLPDEEQERRAGKPKLEIVDVQLQGWQDLIAEEE